MTTLLMRRLLICFALLGTAQGVEAQPASQPGAQPATQPAPGGAQPAARPAAPSMTIHVTDGAGAPLAGVAVEATGPLPREGVTSDDGAVRFANLRTGSYRLRFTREGFITLERDITVRAGQPARIDVMLSAAPPPPPPPKEPEIKAAPPEPAAPPPVRPPGEPKTVSLPDFVEQNFIGRAGRKESALGCTASGTATLLQLREVTVEHAHADADEWIYVVAGEGTLRVGGREEPLEAGVFNSIPRTITHALVPRGRNPLIVVSILSGEPCPVRP